MYQIFILLFTFSPPYNIFSLKIFIILLRTYIIENNYNWGLLKTKKWFHVRRLLEYNIDIVEPILTGG